MCNEYPGGLTSHSFHYLSQDRQGTIVGCYMRQVDTTKRRRLGATVFHFSSAASTVGFVVENMKGIVNIKIS